MPRFHMRAKVHPEEVSVAVANDGVTATILPPEKLRGETVFRDLRLATALHFAGSLADQLGTDVGVLDSIYFIDDVADIEDDIVFTPAA